MTFESDRNTNAALGGFNFSSHFDIRTNEARGGTNAELKANLLDIHNQRLRFMDENNVDFVRRSVFLVENNILTDNNDRWSFPVPVLAFKASRT